MNNAPYATKTVWRYAVALAVLNIPLGISAYSRGSPSDRRVALSSPTLTMAVADPNAMSSSWLISAASAIRDSGLWCPGARSATRAPQFSTVNRGAFTVDCIGADGTIKEYTLFMDRIVHRGPVTSG